jgi:hypothetical protein
MRVPSLLHCCLFLSYNKEKFMLVQIFIASYFNDLEIYFQGAKNVFNTLGKNLSHQFSSKIISRENLLHHFFLLVFTFASFPYTYVNRKSCNATYWAIFGLD